MKSLVTKTKQQSNRGFTLVEVLMVMMIFTVLAVLTYQGFSNLLDTDTRSRTQMEEQAQWQKTWALLLQDFIHIRPRPTRDQLGDYQRAYRAGDQDFNVVFTRGGYPSLPGNSNMRRVAYSVSRDQELIRWSWPVLDGAPLAETDRHVVMNGVRSLNVEQLNLISEFEPNWPPLNTELAYDAVPRMIRVTIELESGETFQRTIPGLEHSPKSTSDGDLQTTLSQRFPALADPNNPGGAS
ncbi:type II secretion system minor pseudopilin GspJ [Pseudomaricurvus alkylphenolicus]|uniref:type II secretion system minor pseudopilin GspJ n=1 Tax=Pseudomaricurvus alkylphenolicus TaxID=1306991 RepID=UPI0023F8C676|nr:type II secretion system minor pseudopilin GspJ [Pseudomaricurvus alkylphenolicus]